MSQRLLSQGYYLKGATKHHFRNSPKFSSVENRERVKVIDGTIGVPISTQVSFETSFLLAETFS